MEVAHAHVVEVAPRDVADVVPRHGADEQPRAHERLQDFLDERAGPRAAPRFSEGVRRARPRGSRARLRGEGDRERRLQRLIRAPSAQALPHHLLVL